MVSVAYLLVVSSKDSVGLQHGCYHAWHFWVSNNLHSTKNPQELAKMQYYILESLPDHSQISIRYQQNLSESLRILARALQDIYKISTRTLQALCNISA